MKGKRIFSILGFEVKVHISFTIILFMVMFSLGAGVFPDSIKGLAHWQYYLMAVAGAIGLFLSVILHEVSHSVVARRYGIEMKGITLFVLGGCC